MSNVDIKNAIVNALTDFGKKSLYEASIGFWEALAYKSDKKRRMQNCNLDELEDWTGNTIPKKDDFKNKIQKIEFLFQLCDDDINGENTIFSTNEVDISESFIKSYLFMAISLKDSSYSKTELVKITRSINKIFSMPVLILFNYDNLLTLSIIDRRMHKKEEQKDVLEKITLIKDIKIVEPHRAQLDILESLSLENIQVYNFDQLHIAFKNILDLKTINEGFYNELTKWYYYAFRNISLPRKPLYYKTEEQFRKAFTVKLISRVLFCWFLKEKGLINKDLLEIYDYFGRSKRITKDEGDHHFLSSNSYFRGILQPLFFGSLNTPIRDRSFNKEFLSKYLADDFDYEKFIKIPFLNGGLFDLQREDHYNDKDEDDVFIVPNELFYSKSISYKAGSKTINTMGLNVLLSKFKFTVSENTPLEEEVALDPEMLGMIFENLLAELDPDDSISKNAQSESGTFYTPRKIIDYMVNESLILYLIRKAEEINKADYNEKIKYLVYHEVINDVDEDFKDFVVKALDKIKVLDPACGSGAFPMGMLHRIVSILNLVDNDNSKWLKYKLSDIKDLSLRADFEKILRDHMDDYPRKLHIIQDSIYCLDIEPMAIQITKLRFFISLVIEQNVNWHDIDNNYQIRPLPNLESKIFCADSLQDMESNVFNNSIEEKLKEAKVKLYSQDTTKKEKDEAVSIFANYMNKIYPDFCLTVYPEKNYPDHQSKIDANKEAFKNWFHYASFPAPFTNFNVFFPELEHSKFDIVIGNPPYGGQKISDRLKKDLGLDSKDPYGAFIARFINENAFLENKGVLAFIVSDTYMTIKSHLPLRKSILHNYIHKIIRVHPNTFKATVNTAISIFQILKKEKPDPNHICQMVDLTNIDIHKDYDKFLEILYETIEKPDDFYFSSPEYAIYHYPQNLIKTNSHIPFFVGSPKLFKLMNDTTSKFKDKIIDGNKVRFRYITLNENEIELVKLGEIADVKKGIDTGENHVFLFQHSLVKGTYRDINDYRKYLLSYNDLYKIVNNDYLRQKVIRKGIHRSKNENNFDQDLWFGGKYIIPYDKGGDSNSVAGWLPNYNVPTYFYIDWSCESVKLLFLNRNIRNNKSTLRNIEYWFRKGLTFSLTGVYAPTVRLNSMSLFDNKGSCIFSSVNANVLMGVLASKLAKYIFKCFMMHTIDTQVGIFNEFIMNLSISNKFIDVVENIIAHQNIDRYYDYSKNEQVVVDDYVFNIYSLNSDDIEEVENWYARRYPKLVNPKS